MLLSHWLIIVRLVLECLEVVSLYENIQPAVKEEILAPS